MKAKQTKLIEVIVILKSVQLICDKTIIDLQTLIRPLITLIPVHR